MLFELVRWHALTKLQLHSEATLAALRAATTTLGQAVRAFRRHVCPKYAMRELPREIQSRQRRQAAATQKATSSSKQAVTVTPKIKAYTVPDTPKYHRLGDYVSAIFKFSTHDNMSTQTVRC